MKQQLHLLKIGGNVTDNEALLNSFIKDFLSIDGPKVLVHGGGKTATELAAKLAIPQTLVDGRRITGRDTLDVAVMVYAGLINKKIVAKLQASGCDALGLSGADAGLVTSSKRSDTGIDYGFVGDPERINGEKLAQLISLGCTPVFCAVTHDGCGQLLNTNADTMAAEIAIALSGEFDTALIYCFEKPGVMLDPDDESSMLACISAAKYKDLRRSKVVSGGMIPKLDNAFRAFEGGVKKVTICHAANLRSGTELVPAITDQSAVQ
jgi:acetylglutamate kinase